mmetsp:Transcript_111105/g.321122  ORF Transcript_111105/g.321122 Transcript_111105/m.321122 type:complete len:373 (-) Transcript_111105:1042-2160(-)
MRRRMSCTSPRNSCNASKISASVGDTERPPPCNASAPVPGPSRGSVAGAFDEAVGLRSKLGNSSSPNRQVRIGGTSTSSEGCISKGKAAARKQLSSSSVIITPPSRWFGTSMAGGDWLARCCCGEHCRCCDGGRETPALLFDGSMPARPPPSMRCIDIKSCGTNSSTRCLTYSRNSAMSCTRAWFPPRSRNAVSMNWAKLSSRSGGGCLALGVTSSSVSSANMLHTMSKLVSSNKMSRIAMKSSASTPRFPRIMCISGFRMSRSNSSLRSVPLLLKSWTSKMGSKCILNDSMAAASRSCLVTSVTTSHKMPTNMFSKVKWLKNTKNMNWAVMNGDWDRSNGTSSPMASVNVPCKRRYHIASPTVANLSCNSG